MVSSEQGQHSRELGGESLSKFRDRGGSKKKESVLLRTKTGFDVEIKCLENTVLD